jgi:hypothetical protein
MVRPKAVIRWVPALSFALLLWLCVFASVRAFADPYVPAAPGSTTEPLLEGLGSCPAPPAEPYEGTDDAAGEVRLLRADVAAACDALAKRTDEVAHRLWWSVAEQLQARDQRVLTNTLSSEIRDRLDLPLDAAIVAVEPDPLPVTDLSTSEGTDEVTAAIDASGNAMKEAVWFLVGLLAMLAGSTLYRHLKP